MRWLALLQNMSRSVKGLRELICLSRQSFSDQDGVEGVTNEDQCDSDDDGQRCNAGASTSKSLCNGFVSELQLIRSNWQSADTSRVAVCNEQLVPSAQVLSADSALAYHHFQYDNPRPLSDKAGSQRLAGFELLKHKPLPAVGSQQIVSEEFLTDCSTLRISCQKLVPSTGDHSSLVAEHNLVDILKLFDKKVIMSWLQQGKRSIADITDWCSCEKHFVCFAHFWLSEFSEQQRHAALKLEFGLLRERMLSALSSHQLSSDKLDYFLGVILHEYPDRLLGGRQGAYLFLDNFMMLASPCHRNSLLADILCAPDDRQDHENLLAIRSFALVSMWSAILDKYRTGDDVNSQRSRSAASRSRPTSARPATAQSQSEDVASNDLDDVNLERIYQAIKLGFIDVIEYLMDSGKVSSDACNADNKSLIFYATLDSKPAILRFLLTLPLCSAVVNMPAESGNTPLHAAANRGDCAAICELLTAMNIKIDAPNEQCSDATPLHLAAMHGHTEVVRLLVEAGADVTKTMAGKMAVDIARDFEHDDVVEMLQNSAAK